MEVQVNRVENYHTGHLPLGVWVDANNSPMNRFIVVSDGQRNISISFSGVIMGGEYVANQYRRLLPGESITITA